MAKTLTRQQHLELYYYMRLNRAVEDTMVKLFRQNKIVGGLYSSLGQEAISVGTAYALERRDWMAPMIRNIGALLVKGVPPRDIFTQHMAKYTSPTRGKDGTSHFGDLENLHIVSPISMLGRFDRRQIAKSGSRAMVFARHLRARQNGIVDALGGFGTAVWAEGRPESMNPSGPRNSDFNRLPRTIAKGFRTAA